MGDRSRESGQPGLPAKRFGRRTALAALGTIAAAATAPVPARSAPDRSAGTPPAQPTPAPRPLAPPGPPRALSREQLDTLGHLVETIIPTTDTPGARDAGVHTFLDDVGSIEPDTRAQLQRAIALADSRARSLRNAPFAALDAAGQEAVLDALQQGSKNERDAFEWLKRETVDAYYRSEIGQIGELHWIGHEFHTEFPGACRHSDPLTHPRESWPRPDAVTERK